MVLVGGGWGLESLSTRSLFTKSSSSPMEYGPLFHADRRASGETCASGPQDAAGPLRGTLANGKDGARLVRQRISTR